MNTEEIIEMARQAGFHEHDFPFKKFKFEAFAKLVDAKATEREREACADLCETWYDPMWIECNMAGNELGNAIRNRGDL